MSPDRTEDAPRDLTPANAMRIAAARALYRIGEHHPEWLRQAFGEEWPLQDVGEALAALREAAGVVRGEHGYPEVRLESSGVPPTVEDDRAPITKREAALQQRLEAAHDSYLQEYAALLAERDVLRAKLAKITEVAKRTGAVLYHELSEEAAHE